MQSVFTITGYIILLTGLIFTYLHTGEITYAIGWPIYWGWWGFIDFTDWMKGY